MLPYLKPKKMAATIIMNSKTKDATREGEQPAETMSAAERMLSAIASKDAQALAEAMSHFNSTPDPGEKK